MKVQWRVINLTAMEDFKMIKSLSESQWLKRLNGSRRDSYEEINIPAIQYSLQDVLTFSALSISPVSISTAPDALMATKCLTETLSVPCVFLQTASSQTRPSNIYYHSRMRRLSADRRPALYLSCHALICQAFGH